MTDNNKTPKVGSLNVKFLTYDLGLASSLISLGYTLYKIDRIESKRCQFIFDRDEHIDKMVNDFWDDKLILPARSLLENQKMLKNRLYSVIE